MPEPYIPAQFKALEICGSLACAPHRIGAPVLVSDATDVVCWPPREIVPGAPVVDLIVQSDGAWILTERRGLPGLLTEPEFFPYPMVDGAPCLTGWQGGIWRERVDIGLTVALDQLHAPGSPAMHTWP